MGIYLYAIRAKAHKITLPDGTEAVANEIAFVFNGGSFYTPSSLQRATQARIDRYWEGKALPKYVIRVGSKGVERFAQVYTWTASHPFWIDTDKFHGERVGDVLEVRRGNIRVGEHAHEAASPERMIPHIDPDTGQSRCHICSTSFGEAHPERAAEYRRKQEEEYRAAQERAAKERAEAERRREEAKRAQEVAQARQDYEKASQRLRDLGVEPSDVQVQP